MNVQRYRLLAFCTRCNSGYAYKVEIDDDIKRMMGRFPIPADFNEKAFVGEARLKDYLAL